MANFNKLRSFRNRERGDDKKKWVNNIQNQDGYLYATNFHLFVRAAYESKFEGEAFEDESKIVLSVWFERGEYIGDLNRKSLKKLLEIKNDEDQNNLKLFGACCSIEYVKKILALEANFEVYQSERERRGYVLVGKQYEVVLMQVLHTEGCNCIEISEI